MLTREVLGCSRHKGIGALVSGALRFVADHGQPGRGVWRRVEDIQNLCDGLPNGLSSSNTLTRLV